MPINMTQGHAFQKVGCIFFQNLNPIMANCMLHCLKSCQGLQIMACNANHEMMEKTYTCNIVSVISQIFKMRVLACSNKDSNNFKREFLIRSIKCPEIKVRCAQIEMLSELDLKRIWGGEKPTFKKMNCTYFKLLTKAS